MADDQQQPSWSEVVRPEELRAIISSFKPFAGLSDAAVEALAENAERVFVPAGQLIAKIEPGDPAPDFAFAVEHGRVRLNARVLGPTAAIVELGRGEFALLGTLLSQEAYEGDIFALRDSTLIRLRRADVLRCMTAHPDLIVGYSRFAQDGLLRLFGRNRSNRPQAFAFLPVGENGGTREAADALLQAGEARGRSGTLVDSQRLAEIVGRRPDGEDFERHRHRLSAWCGEQETAAFLLFVCDPEETTWTRWCLEQTDRIVVAVRAERTSEIERIERLFAGRTVAGSPVKVDLLLLHDQGTELPRGTRAWMELDCRRRHHHVRRGHAADFQRAARRIGERAVGVVLGGGGARALAHIGVLQALEEAGIPVDAVGGTSMGSVVAAAHARGWSAKRIVDLMKDRMADSRAIMDLDLPVRSILGGRKLDRVLQFAFEDIDIADLWIPYYCITANLSEARMMVHDRGPLWQLVRASCSLPGIFPPVRVKGQLLVDGGIVNNVPMDIMERECAGGTVIAIDVAGGGGRSLKLEEGKKGMSGWGVLRNRLNPVSANEPFANIMQVLTWSTTLSSKQYVDQLVAGGHVDLFLTPPVQEFELLGFDACEKLQEIGYEYTRKRLAEWDGLQQAVTGRATAG